MFSLVLITLLPSEIAVIKTEAQLKALKPEDQGNTLADFHAKVAQQSIKMVAYEDEVCSVSGKNYPSLPDFCLPDVL